MSYTESERVRWFRDKVVAKVATLGVTDVYSNLENLKSDRVFKKDFVYIHRDKTENVDQFGLGMQIDQTPYYIVLVTTKLTVNRNTAIRNNTDAISNFNELFPQTIIDGMGDSNCPFLLVGDTENDVGNEKDVVGLPGGDEVSFKNKLVIYSKINMKHRTIISTR